MGISGSVSLSSHCSPGSNSICFVLGNLAYILGFSWSAKKTDTLNQLSWSVKKIDTLKPFVLACFVNETFCIGLLCNCPMIGGHILMSFDSKKGSVLQKIWWLMKRLMIMTVAETVETLNQVFSLLDSFSSYVLLNFHWNTLIVF